MSESLATLGYVVNSSQVSTATANLNSMTAAGAVADSTVNDLTTSSTNANSSFRTLAVTLGSVAGALALVGISKNIISSHAEFTESVSQLSAITGATGENLEFYIEQSKLIGETTTLSASQAVTAFKLIASAKPDLLASKEALAEVTKEAVVLAEAAGIMLPDAAVALGSALNQFEISSSKADDVINILAASSQQGSASISTISEAMVNAGSTANAMNISFVDTVAALQALDKGAISGANGGTALRQIMLGLEKTANQNLMPSLVGLSASLEELDKMNLTTTESIKMFGADAFSAVQTILTQRDTFDKLSVSLKDTNTAYEQAGINSDNLSGDYKKLMSVTESLALAIGEELNDSMRSSVQTMTDMLSNQDALTDGITGFASVLGVAAIPTLAGYTTSLYATASAQLLAGTTATSTANAFGVVTTQAATATVATNALGMATKFMLGPWGILIAALGVAATAYSVTKTSAEEMEAALKGQREASDELIDSLSTLNAMDLQKAQMKANEKNLDLLFEQARLQREIANYDAGDLLDENGEISIGGLNDLSDLKDDLDLVDEQLKISTKTLSSIKDQLDTSLEQKGKKEEDRILRVSQAWGEWAASITGYLTPMDKVIAKIDRVNEAIAKGQLDPNNSGVVKYLTAASVELASFGEKFEEDTSYQDWIDRVEASSKSGQLSAIANEIEDIEEALNAGDIDTTAAGEAIDALTSKAENLNSALTPDGPNAFDSIGDSANTALSAIQGLTESGSSEYEKLGIAMQAVNTIQAVGAVLNQGNGDPYSAFARMAAMAASVAALGMSVGGVLGGSFSDSAAENQESQGVNVWGEKSESISNSIDATASATEELVGINTGMLTALEQMSVSISSAAAISIRAGAIDSPSVSGDLFDTDKIGSVIGFLSGGLFSGILGNITGKLLGGSSKTTDQGLELQGDSLGDLQTNASVLGYSEVQYKKWRFGSTKTKTAFEEMMEASTQFSLVFESLADSVFEGATSMGMSAKDAAERINEFEIATQKISLMNLSAEEQQAEIESVFSVIFDDLASSVLPFIDDFSQIGEGAGETLSRLSAQISVAEVLMSTAGVTLGDKFRDMSLFTEITDNLAAMTGGLSEFASKTSDFIDSFAPESVKLKMAGDTVTSALSAVGLSLPETSEGFWELAGALDSGTEKGTEQIATLLNITDAASDYYRLLDSTVGDFNDELSSLSESLMSVVDGMFPQSQQSAFDSLTDALLLAKNGSFDAAMNLDFTNLTPSESGASTAAEFAIQQAKVANKISELATITGTEKTVADLTLSQSIDQTKLLAELKSQQIAMNDTIQSMNASQQLTARRLDDLRNEPLTVRVAS